MQQRIAIVGIGGLFPSTDTTFIPQNYLNRFWQDIQAGRDCSRPVSEDRWLLRKENLLASEIAADKVNSMYGCFLPSLSVDASDFDLDEQVLANLDPVFHILLHAGQQAWQDVRSNRLDPQRSGVVIGNIVLPTDSISTLAADILGPAFESQLLGKQSAIRNTVSPLNRYVAGLPAGVLAKALGLNGGSYTLDAACASSLYALKYASDELIAGRMDVMLAGGVSRPDCLYTQMGFSALGAISKTGHCAPFSEQGDGLVVGEGAGIVVLKRLEDALRDDDHIYATIAGIGLANDISGNLMAPDSEGQLRAMRAAYQQAAWSPEDIDLVECHGTGTPVGDAVEYQSLRTLWPNDATPQQCVLSSVKSNIGHLLTAAGAASLIKVLLAIKHQQLPPTAKFSNAAETIDLHNSPFRILKQAQTWHSRSLDTPRRAAVSAFGFGGINAHVLLEEWLVDSDQRSVVFSPSPQQSVPPIAIVGMEAQFGAWRSLCAFKQHLFSDQQAIPAQVADHWWNINGPLIKGWFIDQLEIPLGRYRIPPAELAEMLPQQLLMLEVAYHAMADAGMHQFSEQQGIRSGVFIGIGLDLNTTNFHFRWSLLNRIKIWAEQLSIDLDATARSTWLSQLQEAVTPALNANRTMGALGGIVASRIARNFNIGGPSFTLSSEESSGLRALEKGLRVLQANELDTVIVGAVDLAGDVRAVLAQHACRTSGPELPLIGEGAAALVLKRHQDAVRDNDKIYAVIKGIGAANGGGVDMSVPTESAYRQAFTIACGDAGTELEAISLFEVHGSGYEQEDTMEKEALNSLIEQIITVKTQESIPRALSSVKNKIGHVGAASGLASVVKASLCLYHNVLPQFDKHTIFDCLHTQTAEQQQHWLRDKTDGPRQAAVSSFSIDGNCLNVILEEANSSAPSVSSITGPQSVLSALSAQHQADPPIPVIQPAKSITIKLGKLQFSIPPLPTVSKRNIPLAHDSTPIWQQCLEQMQLTELIKTETQQLFLRLSTNTAQTLAQAFSVQMSLLQPVTSIPTQPDLKSVLYDRAMCMQIATGSIGKVLGKQFADIDSYPSRVRLPDEPLMLVDRILDIQGPADVLTTNNQASGSITTEHDILIDSWYLDGGHIPTCIAVEAGQADLFLSAYLGIDHITKGLAFYRLLDAKVVFHDSLPETDKTIHYKIHIDEFFQHAGTYFFHFNFIGSVDGNPLLSMTQGQAGFFTLQQLLDGQGIVQTEFDKSRQTGKVADDWQTPLTMQVESYDEQQIEALRRGDLQQCFSNTFSNLNIHKPVGLPGDRMTLVQRILNLDPNGGRFGIGQITGEADIHPDDWFLTCHFSDDRVMPGTLMYECCLHTLRVYLLRMGWVGEEGEISYQPIIGESSQLKCRGQVTASTNKVKYEITLKEIGYQDGDGTPYVLADALIYADGKAIVQIDNLSMQLNGLTKQKIDTYWHAVERHESAKPVLFDVDSIYEFATGKPSVAFGERYRIFDEQRKIARLPRPPYQFLDRIVMIQDCHQWQLAAGGIIEAEYDIPQDAWYFENNRQQYMPFAILIEVALQPCGWLAAYLGSALTSDVDLLFRNLGGSGKQLMSVGAETGTLTTRIKITKVSRSGDTIIQHYDMQVRQGNNMVYQGDTYFGFFSGKALQDQVGIKGLKLHQPDASSYARSLSFMYPDMVPYPQPAMCMIDKISIFDLQGGPKGLGFIRGITAVTNDAWFFKAHFYQDPVWPGSLGLESLLQLLKVFALSLWGNEGKLQHYEFETMALNQSHQWIYRGQIIPQDKTVTVEAVITEVDQKNKLLRADGLLVVDDRIIYQMIDFTLRMSE